MALLPRSDGGNDTDGGMLNIESHHWLWSVLADYCTPWLVVGSLAYL
jgi:hypothetical protein